MNRRATRCLFGLIETGLAVDHARKEFHSVPSHLKVAWHHTHMDALVPPLFVVEADNLVILSDERDATNFFEPWFPREERYAAFDSQGRRFELAIQKSEQRRRLLPGKRRFESVICRPLEATPTGAGQLVAALRRHVKTTTAQASLNDLVATAVRQRGFNQW